MSVRLKYEMVKQAWVNRTAVKPKGLAANLATVLNKYGYKDMAALIAARGLPDIVTASADLYDEVYHTFKLTYGVTVRKNIMLPPGLVTFVFSATALPKPREYDADYHATYYKNNRETILSRSNDYNTKEYGYTPRTKK